MENENSVLQALVKKIDPLDTEQLLSGLTTLSKDMAEYLTARALFQDDAKQFFMVYWPALSLNRRYWEQFGPCLYATMEDSGLPYRFAKRAEQGNPEVQEIIDHNTIQPWTSQPGWELMKGYRRELNDAICGDNTDDEPIDQLRHRWEKAYHLSRRLLRKGFSSESFWYPLVAWLSVLLIKMEGENICPENPN